MKHIKIGILMVLLIIPFFAGLGYIQITHNSTFNERNFYDGYPSGFDSGNQYSPHLYDVVAEGYACPPPYPPYTCVILIPGESENAASSTDYANIYFNSYTWYPQQTGYYSFAFTHSAQAELKNNYQTPSYLKYTIKIEEDTHSIYGWVQIATTTTQTLLEKNSQHDWKGYDDTGTDNINSVYLYSTGNYRFKVLVEIAITGDNGWLSPQEETDAFQGNLGGVSNLNYPDLNWLHFTVYEIDIS